MTVGRDQRNAGSRRDASIHPIKQGIPNSQQAGDDRQPFFFDPDAGVP